MKVLDRFNFLFLVSFSFYSFSIASLFFKDQAPDYLFPIINFFNNSYVLYPAIAGSIIISFIQNRRLVKITHSNQIIDRIIVLTCIESAIMLLGTFAALMFFLVVLFSQDFILQLKIIGFAIVVVILNVVRPKIIRRLNRNSF